MVFPVAFQGDGEVPYGSSWGRRVRQLLRQMAQGMPNVLFLGFIPSVEMPQYYALADIVILPSLSEGLPNVLLEASASENRLLQRMLAAYLTLSFTGGQAISSVQEI